MSLGGTPSAPPPPDPAATSAAQTQSNQQTALYNWGLNNPNINTPLGSSHWNITNSAPTYNMDAYNQATQAWQNAPSGGSSGPQGYEEWHAAHPGTGNSQYSDYIQSYNSGAGSSGGGRGAMPQLSDYMTSPAGNPRTEQSITLSPEQQQLYDQQTQQSIGLSNLANQLQGRVGDYLNQPLPTSGDINKITKDAQDAYYNSQASYLDPQYQKLQSNNDAQLANQGITTGSAAWKNSQDDFARQRDAAYGQARNQAILAGPANAQQLFSLTSAARNQPLNEFNALRSGSQVQMPTFQGMNTANVAPTDVSGNINNAYQGQLDIYNQQVGAGNARNNAFASMMGTLGQAAIYRSDRRLKTNIVRIGQTGGGVPVYKYKYIGDDKTKIGVMSDEVRHIPGAVISMTDGYDAVDYTRVS